MVSTYFFNKYRKSYEHKNFHVALYNLFILSIRKKMFCCLLHTSYLVSLYNLYKSVNGTFLSTRSLFFLPKILFLFQFAGFDKVNDFKHI